MLMKKKPCFIQWMHGLSHEFCGVLCLHLICAVILGQLVVGMWSKQPPPLYQMWWCILNCPQLEWIEKCTQWSIAHACYVQSLGNISFFFSRFKRYLGVQKDVFYETWYLCLSLVWKYWQINCDDDVISNAIYYACIPP